MPSIKTVVQTAAISLAVVVAYNQLQAGGKPRLGA